MNEDSLQSRFNMMGFNFDSSDSLAGVVVVSVVSATLIGAVFLFGKKKKKPTSSLPSPPPYGPTLVEYGKAFMENRSVVAMVAWRSEFGNLFLMKSPLPGIVPENCLVADPAVAKELLLVQTNMYRSPCNFVPRPANIAKLIQDGEGYAVTGIPGDKEDWKWRKNALLREFHHRRLWDTDRHLVEKMLEYAHELCHQLGQAAADSNKPVEVEHLTTQIAIRTIFFFLFGRDNIIFDTERLRQSACAMVQFVTHRAFNPLHPLLKYVPGTECRRRQQGKDAAWKYMQDVIQDELETLLQEHHGTKAVHPDRIPGAAVPSLFRQEPKIYQQGLDALIADIRVFILAGFETTAHTLAFAFGLMAEYPAVADAIAQEGRRAGVLSNSMTPETISSVLEQCPSASYLFSETLRLFPPVPFLPGLCSKDISVTTSEGIPYGLKAGTTVLFSIFGMNRHPQHTPGADPETVDLDRWKNDNTKKPFSMAFNMGAHVCAGKNLAYLEGHLFLLVVATQFQFRFPPNMKEKKVNYDEDVFLFPKDGMPLVVEKRHA